MDFARAWTGFDRQAFRGNIEAVKGYTGGNWIDPMSIDADWRDVFPKMDLRDGFIGDRYPLCADAPPRAFLRAGATWRYLGQNPLPDLVSDPSSFATLRTQRFAPDPRSSALHAALCNATNATCRFRSEVVLGADLACDGAECELDTVRVAQLVPLDQVGANNTNGSYYYEFVRAPCVHLAFAPSTALQVSSGRTRTDQMCADPREIAAVPTCCESTTTNGLKAASCATSEYFGERVSYATASARCLLYTSPSPRD